MDKNIVIGNTSQLAQYFPAEYTKISSRDIDWEDVRKTKWKRAFLCFGESRKFLENESLHEQVNFKLTLNAILKLIDRAESIVVYATCELWNKASGRVNIKMPHSFYNTSYIDSKCKLENYIKSDDRLRDKVITLFPFNFNSTYRDKNFLFGKIFDSIINKKKITIGDTYFYRDMIHPKFVVRKSIEAKSDEIIGSGRIVFVNDFIRELYERYDMDYKDYVTEEIGTYNEYEKRNEYYLKSSKCLYSYDELMNDTINDINKIKF